MAKVCDVEIWKLPIIDVTSNSKVFCSGKVLIWYSADDGIHQKKEDLETSGKLRIDGGYLIKDFTSSVGLLRGGFGFMCKRGENAKNPRIDNEEK